MLAVHISALEGPSAVEVRQVPAPVPGPGDVLVEVRAAGVSFPDLLQTRGLYQIRPDLPFIPGIEVAGVVRTAPPDSGFSSGDHVMAFCLDGGMAELLAVPAATTFPLPEPLSFAQGAALPMNYHTAHFSLIHRGGLRSGETVLVHGAAGGLGTAAVQVARGVGATVIALVSTEAKARVALAAGADEVLRSDAPWKDQVRDTTGGRGVDVVVDPVGGDRFTDSIRALAPGGRLLVMGFASGHIPEVKVNRLLLSNTSLIGCSWGGFAEVGTSVLAEAWTDLHDMIARGVVAPVVGAAFPLEDASDAFSLLDDREATGKVVLLTG